MVTHARPFFSVLAVLVVQLLAARPVAGNCALIVFDEATPGTVYVGFYSFGAFAKSTDNGRTWNLAGRSFYTLGAIVIDPQNSSTLYAATGEGVMKSRDGGQTWAPSGLAGSHIEALVIDPRTPSTLFARASNGGQDYSPGAVYKTVDGGAQWTRANAGLPSKGVRVIGFSRDNSDVLYAGTTSGVFKTTDGGTRWRRTSAGINGSLIANLVVDARNPDTLYVTASGKPNSGVFKSSNGGQTWTNISAGLPRSELQMLAHDPSRAGVVYAGMRGGGLYRTTDAGASWSRVALPNTYPCDVAVSPHDPQVMIAKTNGDDHQGYSALVYRTVDGGTRWDILREGLPSISSIAGAPGLDEKTGAYPALRRGGVKLSPESASSAVVLGSRLAQPPQSLRADR